jgi:hypothetical protein
MTQNLTTALFALLLQSCTSVTEAQATANGQPMDVRILSAPESKEEPEFGLTLATWALVIGTVGGFMYAARRQSFDMRESIAAAKQASDAARRSAELATQAADREAKDRRAALIRETTLAIHRVAFNGASVSRIAKKVQTDLQNMYAMSGRPVNVSEHPAAAMAHSHQVMGDAMAKNSSGYLLNQFQQQPDDTVAQIRLTMESNLENLELAKEELLRELSHIQARTAVLRSTRQAAGGRYPPEFPSDAV